MSWIGISDGRHPILVPQYDAGVTAPLLSTGTIIIEVQFTAENALRQTVAELDRTAQWRRKFRITLGEAGDAFLEQRQGGALSIAVLKFPKPDRDATLRFTISWHAPNRVGLLTIENLDSGEQAQSVIDDPHPWSLDDVVALLHRGKGCQVDPSVTLLAFSDTVEPVNLTAGFAAGTCIDTPNGPCAVENLCSGDLVETAEFGLHPVRAVVTHRVPAFGRFAPIHLRAPFFGLEQNLTVAPDHRLLISGVDAEYLFGSDSVLVEARHLAKIAADRRRKGPHTVTYVQVLLDTHVCLSVAGAWGESLYLGDLADHPARHATSLLAKIPARDLPRHTRIASPELRSYEAMVLMSAMCA